MEKVYEIYNKTTPERLWEEVSDPALAARMLMPEGQVAGFPPAEGDDVESDPPKRLVRTMHAKWSPEVEKVGPTRITYEIEPVGDSCRLMITHDQIPEDATDEIWGGWPMILSALKTRLETGEHLTTPASLRFGSAA
jgi:uncharacterized protein YndB with AHSA1/START domain